MSVGSNYCSVLCFFTDLCLAVLFIIERVLKSSTIIVQLFLPSSLSIFASYILKAKYSVYRNKIENRKIAKKKPNH